MHKMLIALFAACVVTLALSGAAPALAQEAAATAAAPSAGDAPYHSAMRSQCEDEIEKDADWRADIKLRIAPEVHTEDAQQMLTNRRHVVMAYAALWVLVAGFVVFMWLRQRGLQAEIERLEREIAQAAKE